MPGTSPHDDNPAGRDRGALFAPVRRRPVIAALCALGFTGVAAGVIAFSAYPQSLLALAKPSAETAGNASVIHSVQDLNKALERAQGGETFLLAPGDYARIAITDRTFASPVTIASQSADRRAKVMALTVRRSTGLIFRDLEFVAAPGRTGSHSIFNARNVRFENLFVHGSLDNDPSNDPAPFLLRDSHNVVVANSMFQELHNGLGFMGGSNLRITGNVFFRMRTDGIRGGGVSNIRIDNNLCTGFQPIENDHPDCIQFWTTNTTSRAENIVVERNVSLRGDGKMTQGIFIRDTENLPFKNVSVRYNLLIGNQWHGIYVDGAEGVELRGNQVAPFTDHRSWILVKNSRNVDLVDNSAPQTVLQNNQAVNERGGRKNAAVTDGGRSVLQNWHSSYAPPETISRALTDMVSAGDGAAP